MGARSLDRKRSRTWTLHVALRRPTPALRRRAFRALPRRVGRGIGAHPMSENDKLAIVVGGGPAPGINSVIGAATIRACLSGIQVVGLKDGYEWVMKGDTSHTVPLRIEDT